MPEVVPIVDEHDHIIGSEKLSVVHTRGLLHRETYVYLINEKRVLLQMRADNGLWDHSAAGHFPVNESYLEGAMRELREELGLTVSPEEFQEIAFELFESRRSVRNNVRFARVFLVRLNLPLKSIKIDPNEVKKVKYFDKPAVEDLLEGVTVTDSARYILKKYILPLI